MSTDHPTTPKRAPLDRLRDGLTWRGELERRELSKLELTLAFNSFKAWNSPSEKPDTSPTRVGVWFHTNCRVSGLAIHAFMRSLFPHALVAFLIWKLAFLCLLRRLDILCPLSRPIIGQCTPTNLLCYAYSWPCLEICNSLKKTGKWKLNMISNKLIAMVAKREVIWTVPFLGG